jgi:hypothetical protein
VQGEMAHSHAFINALTVLLATVAASSAVATAAAPSAEAASAEPDVFQPCAFPDFEGAVQRMSKVLTFQTVSDPDVAQHLVDPAQFKALDAYLSQAYPKVRVAATAAAAPVDCWFVQCTAALPSSPAATRWPPGVTRVDCCVACRCGSGYRLRSWVTAVTRTS